MYPKCSLYDSITSRFDIVYIHFLGSLGPNFIMPFLDYMYISAMYDYIYNTFFSDAMYLNKW